MSTDKPKPPADDWDRPAPAPLAAGLRMGPPPASPKLELEAVNVDEPLPADVIELQEVIRGLKRDNQVLMNQIEEAWAVVKSRDETIEYLSREGM